MGPACSIGRKGLSAESIFRCMQLKQITGDNYEKLAFHLRVKRGVKRGHPYIED